MRIAIVSDYFPDFVGGAQTSMREQRLALQAAGHHVVMVSAVRGGPGGRYRRTDDGLQVKPSFTLPGVQLPVIPNNPRTTKVLEEFLREHKIDVVHVQTEFGLAHAAATVAARMGIPVVHTVHTFYWASDGGWHAPLEPLIRGLLRRVIRWEIPRQPFTPRPVDNLLRNLTLSMAKRADVVVSPSAHQAKDLQSAGVAGPVRVVPNPVTTSPAPSRPLGEVAEPRFLWVARCDTVKRPLEFAQGALDALERTGGGFSVDFVGDGTELPALKRLVGDRPEVRVHGALPHDRVLELMDESSAVVLSSLGFDNQPMTIAEAVSRDRGVLYADPKLKEGLQGAGYLAHSADPAGFADALVKLTKDPSILVRMSKNAATDAAEFSAQTYVSRILIAYVAAKR
ncbi:glycosyltransferase family 4 protein [Cryobacterium sp. BB307]|uniref:glycosyltransferase family 4 protein n=1 Tax=Cryobacterium sp. BB307 TaxID=2716317 RepID=UPI001444F883|nr:glycosyltransferase family 4 protein [Cryobacterium sp. BB307]